MVLSVAWNNSRLHPLRSGPLNQRYANADTPVIYIPHEHLSFPRFLIHYLYPGLFQHSHLGFGVFGLEEHGIYMYVEAFSRFTCLYARLAYLKASKTSTLLSRGRWSY